MFEFIYRTEKQDKFKSDINSGTGEKRNHQKDSKFTPIGEHRRIIQITRRPSE